MVIKANPEYSQIIYDHDAEVSVDQHRMSEDVNHDTRDLNSGSEDSQLLHRQDLKPASTTELSPDPTSLPDEPDSSMHMGSDNSSVSDSVTSEATMASQEDDTATENDEEPRAGTESRNLGPTNLADLEALEGVQGCENQDVDIEKQAPRAERDGFARKLDAIMSLLGFAMLIAFIFVHSPGTCYRTWEVLLGGMGFNFFLYGYLAVVLGLNDSEAYRSNMRFVLTFVNFMVFMRYVDLCR